MVEQVVRDSQRLLLEVMYSELVVEVVVLAVAQQVALVVTEEVGTAVKEVMRLEHQPVQTQEQITLAVVAVAEQLIVFKVQTVVQV